MPMRYALAKANATDAALKPTWGAPARSRIAQAHSREGLVILLIYLCILQNFFLALLNRVAGVNDTIVVICQLILTLAALMLAILRGFQVRPSFWFLCAAWAGFAAVAAANKGTIELKFFYDAILIPIFILLGTTIRQIPLRHLIGMIILVAVVGIWEAVSPSSYGVVVNPLAYFFNTRAWVHQFVASGKQDMLATGLYIAASRPGGTIIGFLSEMRISSVFLEPLSLGYFCIIASIAINSACLHQTKILPQALLIGSLALLASLSDSRLAVLLVGMLALGSGLLRRLPKEFGFAIFVSMMIAAAVLSTFDDDSNRAFGDLGLRLSITFDTLSKSNLDNLLFGGIDLLRFGDSGVLYFIDNCGIFGAVLALMIYSGYSVTIRFNPLVSHSALIYLFAAALFGGAFFSIKTAALLGIIVGSAGHNSTTA